MVAQHPRGAPRSCVAARAVKSSALHATSCRGCMATASRSQTRGFISWMIRQTTFRVLLEGRLMLIRCLVPAAMLRVVIAEGGSQRSLIELASICARDVFEVNSALIVSLREDASC